MNVQQEIANALADFQSQLDQMFGIQQVGRPEAYSEYGVPYRLLNFIVRTHGPVISDGLSMAALMALAVISEHAGKDTTIIWRTKPEIDYNSYDGIRFYARWHIMPTINLLSQSDTAA